MASQEMVSPAARGREAAARSFDPADSRIRVIEADGTRREMSLQEAAGMPLWTVLPSRRFPRYRGQHHISGWHYWATGGYMVPFESRLEETVLRHLDFDESVCDVAAQPCEVVFPDGSRHTPDFSVRFHGGRTGLIDVSTKRASEGDRKARSFRLTASVCDAAGWSYEVRTEPDRVLAANIGWITSYRLRPPEFECWMPAIMAGCRNPRPIATIRLLSSSPFLVPALGHLLWLGRLGCDLTQPLCEATMVWTRRVQAVDRV